MSSRDKILDAVKKNQPKALPLPLFTSVDHSVSDPLQRFIRTLGSIGGTAIETHSWEDIEFHLNERFLKEVRWVNMVPELGNIKGAPNGADPHLLENVKLAILKGHFGVTENGAVWVTDDQMGDRALPFICEHLAVIVQSDSLVNTMHDAYEKIGQAEYNFGTFIAGPSKTADIEQSLVLGAHGPKTMTVFLLSIHE